MAQAPRKTWIVAALIALLALVAAGVWWAQRDSPANANPTAETAETVDRDDALRRKQATRERATARERVAISGQVTRAADGTGIPGAVVLISRKDPIQGQAPNPGEPTVPLTVTTDANGGWELASVDPGRYVLSATAVGFLPATNDDVRVGDSQTSLNLSMEPGGALLSGTVTDIGGGPVEGVLVRVSSSEALNIGFNAAPLAAISDEDGEYQLQIAKGRYSISTFHPDYVAEARRTDVPTDGRREDFKLIPGATIEGVVRARPEGEPVAGARVTFFDSRRENPTGLTTNFSVDGSVVVTDEQGRFRLTGLRAGVVGLMARSSGHASVAPEEVAVGIGEQVTEVELWVDTAYTISGYVVPKNEPEGGIEGVLVGAWQMQPLGMLMANAPTASDGYFEIVGVQPGVWQVGAVGEDHLFSLTGATARIEDRDVSDLLVELETGIYVRGRVDPGMHARLSLKLDPASFSLTNIGGAIADAIARGQADEDGVFEIGPIKPGTGFGGREVAIVAENDEGFRGETVVKLRGEDVEGLVIALTKGASVSGTVLDSNGVPQRGAVVSVEAADPKSGAPGINILRLMQGSGVPTGDEGQFAVRGLELGKHLVVVKDSKGRAMDWASGGEDSEEGEPTPIEIELEDTVNEQFLDLRVVPRDAEISGVVLDAEGLPVPDAWVRANLDTQAQAVSRPRSHADKTERIEGVMPKPDPSEAGSRTRSGFTSETPVLTDENGLFVIKQLRRDRNYQLIAEGERGGARATLESVATGSRVTLRLEQLGGIDGVVTLDGKPIADYSVELTGPANRTKRVVHPKGEFRLDRLDPGKYALFVRADAGTGEAEVELGEADRAQVKIELARSGTVKGQVVGEQDGEPIAGLSIVITNDGRIGDAGAAMGVLTGQGPKTDADGRFELSGVAPGRGELEFMNPGSRLSGSITVAEAEFELDPGAVLDLGTLEALQGEDVAQAERGSLQMRMTPATWAKRPRPPGTDLDAEEAEEQADETVRLWVYSVDVGGVAARAGVVPGDEIVTIDGASVASLGATMAAARLGELRLRAGQEVRLGLMRDEDAIDVRIEAAGSPE